MKALASVAKGIEFVKFSTSFDIIFQITIVTVMLIVAITIGVICRIQCQTIASSPMIPASPRTESDIHDKNMPSNYGEL